MRHFWILPTIFLIAGCQTTAPPSVLDAIAKMDATDLSATAYAEKRTSEAKGEKTCYVTQSASAYKTKLAIDYQKSHGYSVEPRVSDTVILVQPDGSAYISVAEDKYPGSTQYFKIGGERFSGPENRGIRLSRAALESIGRDEIFQYTWTDWPDRVEADSADAYRGFEAAYADCLSFLKQ